MVAATYDDICWDIGQRLQTTYITGRLITEGKISPTVMTTLEDSVLTSTGQLVDEGPGWR